MEEWERGREETTQFLLFLLFFLHFLSLRFLCVLRASAVKRTFLLVSQSDTEGFRFDADLNSYEESLYQTERLCPSARVRARVRLSVRARRFDTTQKPSPLRPQAQQERRRLGSKNSQVAHAR